MLKITRSWESHRNWNATLAMMACDPSNIGIYPESKEYTSNSNLHVPPKKYVFFVSRFSMHKSTLIFLGSVFFSTTRPEVAMPASFSLATWALSTETTLGAPPCRGCTGGTEWWEIPALGAPKMSCPRLMFSKMSCQQHLSGRESLPHGTG